MCVCVCVSLFRIVPDSIKSFFFSSGGRGTVYDNHSRLLVTSGKESIAHNLFAKEKEKERSGKEKKKGKREKSVADI